MIEEQGFVEFGKPRIILSLFVVIAGGPLLLLVMVLPCLCSTDISAVTPLLMPAWKRKRKFVLPPPAEENPGRKMSLSF